MPYGKYKGVMIADLPLIISSGLALKASRKANWVCF